MLNKPKPEADQPNWHNTANHDVTHLQPVTKQTQNDNILPQQTTDKPPQNVNQTNPTEDQSKTVISAVDYVLTLGRFYEIMNEFKHDVFKPP